MSTNYGELERQFLESLKADTGRDLAAWMEAIGAENLDRRNDIIDWLRRQGFMFSKASWLERIHNNGGRPIYSDQGAKRPQRRPRVPREAATILPFVPRAPAAARAFPAGPTVVARRPAPSTGNSAARPADYAGRRLVRGPRRSPL